MSNEPTIPRQTENIGPEWSQVIDNRPTAWPLPPPAPARQTGPINNLLGRRTMSDNDELIIYPVPSLVATLLNRERANGSPLTEKEVLAMRDAAPSIAMPRDVAAKVDEARGYLDIDPDDCWNAWQRARVELVNKDIE